MKVAARRTDGCLFAQIRSRAATGAYIHTAQGVIAVASESADARTDATLWYVGSHCLLFRGGEAWLVEAVTLFGEMGRPGEVP